jgi:hypothetical protein
LIIENQIKEKNAILNKMIKENKFMDEIAVKIGITK